MTGRQGLVTASLKEQAGHHRLLKLALTAIDIAFQ